MVPAGTRFFLSFLVQFNLADDVNLIANYQLAVPSTWNASPRDARGQRSAYEAALLGTPVHDPKQPLEIIRTIHSFDPCLACAVHLYEDGAEVAHEELLVK